jgi:hypothetical protein
MTANTTDAGLVQKAYSIDEFCKAYRISKATLFREWKRGRGPEVKKVGRRSLITVAAAEAWERGGDEAAA